MITTEPMLLEVNCHNLIKGIGSLRYDVWQRESDSFAKVFPLGMWLDPDDMEAKHFAVFCDGMIVAAARVTIHDNLNDIPDFPQYALCENQFKYPIASFNRLVVKREYRKRGIASMLVEARLKYAAENARGAVCIGHGRQADRLQRYGFKDFGIAKKYSTLYKTFPEDSMVLYHDLNGIEKVLPSFKKEKQVEIYAS